MTLSRKSVAAVEEALRDGLPRTVSVEAGPSRLAIDLVAADSIGVAFRSLELHRADRSGSGVESLRVWGERLSERVHYLLEPLVVLEVDQVGGTVEIKSKAPSHREGLKSYYELRIGPDASLRFGRVAYSPDTKSRSTIDCRLTREAFERLVDDLADSAD